MTETSTKQDTSTPVDRIAPLDDVVSPVILELPTYKRAVYERLSDMISSFELAPGTRLVETELAGRLRVSKTPVREAIALVEADGLVEAFPYRGAIVRWLSVNEMLEQGYLLDALEMPAYVMVVDRIAEAELQEIGQIANQLRRARRVNDERRFTDLALAIHTRLFACTGFPRLHQLIGLVLGPVGLRYDRLLTYRFDDAWDALTDLAVERVDAVRQRDAELAVEVVRARRTQHQAMALDRVRMPEIARYFRDA